MKNTFRKTKHDNRGLSLIELIIVIAIMGILTGVLTPMFLKYVEKSKKSKDVYTADQIARAVNVAFVENPEAYDKYQKWGSEAVRFSVSATTAGRDETYDIYLVAANDMSKGYRNSNCFKGGEGSFGNDKGETGFYGVINRELGLSTTEYNASIAPKYTTKRASGPVIKRKNNTEVPFQDIDRWRIVKRKDNGMMEIWAAQPDPCGGYPVYRVWPEPDDLYRE